MKLLVEWTRRNIVLIQNQYLCKSFIINDNDFESIKKIVLMKLVTFSLAFCFHLSDNCVCIFTNILLSHCYYQHQLSKSLAASGNSSYCS